jgi:S1-C subfamily serine protease
VRGVLVLGVLSGSGAERAGFLPTRRDPGTGAVILGDIIVAVNAQPITRAADLYAALDERKVGDRVTVTVQRGDKRLDLHIVLMSLTD